MAQTYQPTPGRVAVVTIQTPGIELAFNRFAWDAEVDMLDASSFVSKGFREFGPGMASNTFVFAGILNDQWNPFKDTPKLKLGTIVSDVSIDVSTSNSLQVVASNAFVTRWQIMGTPQGWIEYVCALQSDWQFQDWGPDATA
jgi:hypothetical protein